MGYPLATSSARVLLVDDEPLVLRLMERALADGGFEVHCASNGLRALELAGSLQPSPSVLVTDIRMEPIDGVSLAKLIVHHWPATRVLFVSGYDPDQATLRAPLLRKPFSPDQLVESVRQLFPASGIVADPA